MAMAMVCAGVTACSSGASAPAATKAESKAEEKADESKEETGGEKKDGYVIGLAMNTQTNPFFVDVKDGVQKAADEHGIELYITDAQDDPTIQMKDVENLITKNPDAIIIDTCDSDAIVSSIEACNEAGIPVFTMDREANGGDVISPYRLRCNQIRQARRSVLVDSLVEKERSLSCRGIMGTNVRSAFGRFQFCNC